MHLMSCYVMLSTPPHTECTTVLNFYQLRLFKDLKKNVLHVLPGVLRAAEVPLDLGGVMPTWAVMPLLHEPVWDIWDIWAIAAAF